MTPKLITFFVLATLPTFAAQAATDAGHSRPRTVEALERALAKGGKGLDLALNGGSSEVAIGQPIVYGFESNRDGYLTVLHLDGEGVVTVLYPNTAGDDGRLAASTARSFPPNGQGLEASLPTGVDEIFAFSTPKPFSPTQLGLDTRAGDFPIVDPEVAPDFASCLADHIAAQPPGSVQSARVAYAVKPADEALPYDPASIETYFTTKTRSIRRPSMNLLIHFGSDSSDLTPDAQQKLDQVGKALKGKKLSSLRFKLAGHTDDLGDAGYNEDLSMRRARTAHVYLKEHYDVDTTQLSFVGHGEAQPKMDGQSEEARAENRRVELELVPAVTRGAGARFVCGAP